MKDLFEAIVTFFDCRRVLPCRHYRGGDSGGYLGHRPDDCGFVFAEKKS